MQAEHTQIHPERSGHGQTHRGQRQWVLGFLLIGIVVGLLVLGVTRSRDSEQKANPRVGDLIEAVYGLGTVTAEHKFQLKIGVTSAVAEVYVREGEEVQAKAPLLRLDEGSVFRSPFAGTVTSIAYKRGETVYPQSPLLTLVDLKERYVVVTLEQEGALRVRRGQLARLAFESLRSKKFDGVVRTIFPSEGQFLVYVDVKDLPAEVLPGMTADVAIEIERKKGVLMVPVAALSNGKLRLQREGRTRKIDVQVGTVDGEWAEILSGDVKTQDEVFLPGK